jgi:hypothetical protein
MVNLLKIRWDESLTWETNDASPGIMKIIPVNFNTEHKNMLSNLHAVVSKGYLAIIKSSCRCIKRISSN